MYNKLLCGRHQSYTLKGIRGIKMGRTVQEDLHHLLLGLTDTQAD